jgi:hypothetical protein
MEPSWMNHNIAYPILANLVREILGKQEDWHLQPANDIVNAREDIKDKLLSRMRYGSGTNDWGKFKTREVRSIMPYSNMVKTIWKVKKRNGRGIRRIYENHQTGSE